MVDLIAVLPEIHTFWFGELGDPDTVTEDQSNRWFRQSDGFDDQIRSFYGDLLAPAAEAAWDIPALTASQRVALIVLFDQFPRNLFRTSGEAFAYDPLARRIADESLRAGGNYHPLERVFLYLPFEHSENLADQDRAVSLYQQLLAERGTANPFYKSALDYAEKHRALIQGFGRFPHRNAMLGRPSTPEELAFLQQHGRGF